MIEVNKKSGSPEAIAAGKKIWDNFREIPNWDPAHPEKLLGTPERAKQIEDDLKSGKIIKAIKNGNLVQGDPFSKFIIEEPTALLAFGVDFPSLPQLGSLRVTPFIKALAVAGTRKQPKFNEDSGDVDFNNAGLTVLRSVGKVGAKGTFQFKEGLKLTVIPAAHIPIGIPDTPLARFNLQVEWSDKTREFIPLHYTVLVEYETQKTFKYTLTGYLGLIKTPDATLMLFFEGSHMPFGQKDIPEPTLNFSPGIKLTHGELDLGVQGIIAPKDNTYGAGAFAMYKGVKGGISVQSTETETFGSHGSIRKWFPAITFEYKF